MGATHKQTHKTECGICNKLFTKGHELTSHMASHEDNPVSRVYDICKTSPYFK